MIVDHFSTTLQGGAGIAAQRLHLALRRAGVCSRLWIKRPRRGPTPSCPGTVAIDWPLAGEAESWTRRVAAWSRRRWARWELKYALHRRPAGFEIFSTARRERPTPYNPQLFKGKVLHLHWVTGFLDWRSFFLSLPPQLPIVWTLHDMNPFTGGCHHADECRAYEGACHTCPQLGRRGNHDLAARSFADKQAAYGGQRMHVVVPSQWMESHARRSALLSAAVSIHTIPHGLDVEKYAPLEKAAARQQLGLPPEGVVIAFGAAAVDHPRKGFRDLLAALALLRPAEALIGLTFGGGDLPETGPCFREVKRLPYLADPRRQSTVYSAADFFVSPSYAESFGLTGLEAMACGTPVVAYDAGGVTEYVRPGQTGLLARLRDVADLARHLGWMIEHPEERRRMGQQARDMVTREFDQRVLTQRYIDLYFRAVAGRGRERRKAA